MGLELLGTAALPTETLTEYVSEQLGATATLLSVDVTAVDYDLDAITTAGRWWVRGHATTPAGTARYAFFVKHVQAWSRSPMFAMVPESLRAMAEASVPWRTEADLYRTGFAAYLPPGLTAPRAYAVHDLDEKSASIWLEELAVRSVAWDTERYVAAAGCLGRLAGAAALVPFADLHSSWRVADYFDGRLAHAVIPALHADEVWAHPLARPFAPLRARLLAAADRAALLTGELDAMPWLTGHGDACPNNLLAVDGIAAFVLIDYGFWGRRPLGFDLGQLLVGEVQLGRAPGAQVGTLGPTLLEAYVDGLAAEGVDVEVATVRRAHAVQLILFTALSCLPLEHFDRPPSAALLALSAERATMTAAILDLLDATDEPGPTRRGRG